WSSRRARATWDRTMSTGTPMGDGHEIGPQRAELRSVLLRCIPQGGEGLLDDVLGESVVTEHAPCHRSDGDVVEMEDLLEGAFVAIADPAGEGAVGDVWFGHVRFGLTRRCYGREGRCGGSSSRGGLDSGE